MGFYFVFLQLYQTCQRSKWLAELYRFLVTKQDAQLTLRFCKCAHHLNHTNEFPLHDFSKLRHSIEPLILREKGEKKPPTLNKPPKPNPTMDFSALYLLDQKRHRQKIIAFLPFILPPPTLLWCSLHKFPSSFGSTLSYIRYK